MKTLREHEQPVWLDRRDMPNDGGLARLTLAIERAVS